MRKRSGHDPIAPHPDKEVNTMDNASPLRTVLSLAAAIAVPLIIGGIGGMVTANTVGSWYPTLNLPSWNPPNWLFAPVWTTLYILMGIAAWRVWRLGGAEPAVRAALFFFGLQLLFNLGWSLLFFGAQRLDLALMEILVLLALLVVTTLRFSALDRWAGWLLVPYLAWTTFATVLNGTIWWLNR
jgi:benzodiazapine receptor